MIGMIVGRDARVDHTQSRLPDDVTKSKAGLFGLKKKLIRKAHPA